MPEFTVGRGRAASRRCRSGCGFPLIVKSLFFEASAGISQASVVENDEQLARRVTFIHESLGTAAIVEQFIDGRELYVGVLGNERLEVLPVWEMSFAEMPDNRWRIATERVKWSTQYQKKHGIMTDARRARRRRWSSASSASPSAPTARSTSTATRASTCAWTTTGRVYVLEANPNPEPGLRRGLRRVGRSQPASRYERLLERIIALGLRWEPARTG